MAGGRNCSRRLLSLEQATPSLPVTRFLIPCLILAGLITGYLLVSAPFGDRLSGLFSLDYEIPVEVRKAEKSPVGNFVTAQGRLEPLKEIKISATIPGVLKEVRYAAGDKVAAGAVVAAIEAKDLAERLTVQEAAIKEAEAHLKKSESQLAAAEKQFASARDLYQKDFIARREMEQAETAVNTARLEKEAAQAHLAQRISMSAQTRHVLGLARITAPIGGVVTRRWAEPGAPVAEAAPILSVAPAETLRIVLNLKSSDAEKIRPATAALVKVDVSPEKDFRGFVKHVQEIANFTGDELSVEIEVANPGGVLKYGMPASVSFITGERRHVPRTALIQGQGSTCVFINQGGRARQRNITPGKQQNGEIEVVSGLETGDMVVVSGAERLIDGSRVRVVK
jgi:HlyD family secretion protein